MVQSWSRQCKGFAEVLESAAANRVAAELQFVLEKAGQVLGLSASALAFLAVDGETVEELWTWPIGVHKLGPMWSRQVGASRRLLFPPDVPVLLPLANHYRLLMPLQGAGQCLGVAEFAAEHALGLDLMVRLDELAVVLSAALLRRRRTSARSMLIEEIDTARTMLEHNQRGTKIHRDLQGVVHEVANATHLLRELAVDLPSDAAWGVRAVLEQLEKSVLGGLDLAEVVSDWVHIDEHVEAGIALERAAGRVRHAAPDGVQIQVVHQGEVVAERVPVGMTHLLAGLALHALAVPDLVGVVVLRVDQETSGLSFSVSSSQPPTTVPTDLQSASELLFARICLDEVGIRVCLEPPEQADALAYQPEGPGVVLAVDDEPLILEVIERILTGYGYHVLVANSGEAALRVAASHSGRIDVLLTDLVLPDIPGSVLCGEVAKQADVGATLFMSGFHDGALRERGVQIPKADRLTKPFLPSELLEQIERKITEQRTGGR